MIGGVEYEASYQTISGTFAGNGEAVECTALELGGFFQFNDHDASKVLATGYTNATGLAGPADLAECTYQTNDIGIVPGDFHVETIDATAPGSGQVDATVVVSSVTCTN